MSKFPQFFRQIDTFLPISLYYAWGAPLLRRPCQSVLGGQSPMSQQPKQIFTHH